MIKKLFFAIIAVAITGQVTAQQIKFGAKAGLNLATFKGADLGAGADLKTKYGVAFGATAEFSLTDKFSVQPELLFSQQGLKATIEVLEDNEILDVDFNVNYLSVPVLAKYYVLKGLSLEAGPQVSFLLSEKITVNGIEAMEAPEPKKVDFSANIGLGYQFDNGLFVQGRYNHGFTNINEEGDDAQNEVFQFSIGYQF